MKLKRFYDTATALALMAVVGLTGCDKFEYHPYDGHVEGPTGLTRYNIALIESQCAGKDTIRIAQISDTQRWYDETQDMVDDIAKRPEIDFVVHCGDQSDFGMTKEFEWQRDIFAGLGKPYVCVIGNHDCLGTGEDVYHTIYGPDNFSFNASFLHVVCLNTNSFEYDYASKVPDFNFMRDDCDTLKAHCDTTLTRTIAVMHAAPNSEQFDNNVSDFFNYRLRHYPNLLFCLCGHDHHTVTYHPYGDDMPFYEIASAKYRSYYIYTITRNGYTQELIQL